MVVYKNYLETSTGHKVRVTIDYNKGKYNLSMQPLDNKRESGNTSVEEYDPMLGMRDTIHKVGKRSDKQTSMAISIYRDNLNRYKDWFVENKNITIM